MSLQASYCIFSRVRALDTAIAEINKKTRRMLRNRSFSRHNITGSRFPIERQALKDDSGLRSDDSVIDSVWYYNSSCDLLNCYAPNLRD
jgi:hypothetical protein